MSKIIAVVGATGAQGGGLARAILNDPGSGFTVRALTRNPGSDQAKSLSDMGADVVQADLDDVESLRKAFEGAHGAFCVTNYWELFSVEREMQQAANLAEAAKAAGVKHVIWSTLEDTREWIPLDDDRMPTIQEKYKVPHFDSKGSADRYFTDAGLPVTFLLTSFYWDNFIHFGLGPQRGEDGSLNLVFPMQDANLPGIASEDIGKCAYGIFKRRDEFVGRKVAISGENLTGSELAKQMSKALDLNIGYYAIDADTFRSFDFPGADDVGNMFQFYADFEDYFSGIRNPEFARSLNPELLSFRDWLELNGHAIPIPKEESEAVS